ncbi:unnamed protein product [Effrenium voratum]|uniref:Ubiquitin-like domain-containing protein n=1 Tax=Effrenium voratum TaxID=2562239 RepID=A0AA36HNB5_9DINO|nr:unnamed protein product [Effrenium voratum]CAJ1460682.1 unnamed protein product [Effrenium voratum]
MALKQGGYTNKGEEVMASLTPSTDVPSSSIPHTVGITDDTIVKVYQLDDDKFDEFLSTTSIEDLAKHCQSSSIVLKHLFNRVDLMKKKVKLFESNQKKEERLKMKKHLDEEKKKEKKMERETSVNLRIDHNNQVFRVAVQLKSTVGDLRREIVRAMGLPRTHATKCVLNYKEVEISQHPRRCLSTYKVMDDDYMVATFVFPASTSKQVHILGEDFTATIAGDPDEIASSIQDIMENGEVSSDSEESDD